MKIYHIEFAKLGNELSGGENCMLQLIKNFSLEGHENILLTTDNGYRTYSPLLADKITKIKFEIIKSYKYERRFGMFASYIVKLIMALKLVWGYKLEENGLVICHSEFFPNSIPNWILLLRNPKSIKQMAFYHMKAPNIFKGYEGEFTGKLQFPRLTIIHYQLNQILFRVLTSHKSIILTVNSYYKDFLTKIYPHNKIVVLEHYGGYNAVLSDVKKEYDLIWVGRFHRQKGIDDFFKIISEVKKTMPELRVALLGGANKEMEADVKEKINELGLQDTINYPGFVTGKAKATYYQKSKIFMMTSYYESFGQVIIEAMSYKLPVIGYNLPVYSGFSPAFQSIKLLDHNNMSVKILDLLSDTKRYDLVSNQSASVARKHTWHKTALDILNA